jgi:hypothetical protein
MSTLKAGFDRYLKRLEILENNGSNPANEKLQHQKTNRKGILWTCLSRNQHGNPRRGGNQSHPCLRERAMRGYPSNCIFEFQLTF